MGRITPPLTKVPTHLVQVSIPAKLKALQKEIDDLKLANSILDLKLQEVSIQQTEISQNIYNTLSARIEALAKLRSVSSPHFSVDGVPVVETVVTTTTPK